MIIKKDGTIEGITREIIALLRVDKDYIQNNTPHIKNLFPKVWKEINSIVIKNSIVEKYLTF